MKLKILDLSFSYDNVKTLKNISLNVEGGEILGIIGPNGSGKTTLLKCINRKLRPETGAVLIADKDILKFSRKEIAKNIGVVPQISFISFPFTVFDIVMMGRYSHQLRFKKETEKDTSIIWRSLEITGIKHLSERPITEISGGEYQRVIIARALAQQPKILLLDEPTLHLDINHQLEILDLVCNLARKEKLAVVMVLHDLNMAARFSDKLLLLEKGKVYGADFVQNVLTCENIEKVFQVKVKISHDSETNILNVSPLYVIPPSVIKN
ncbi:MAG: ABC transporter ATP-binding protein [Elusimicrobia bacterium]|nr:ABC transporter ATP-binding protein [Elusimicrobiota bacterium]